MVTIVFKQKNIRRYGYDCLQTEEYVDMVTIVFKQKTYVDMVTIVFKQKNNVDMVTIVFKQKNT